MFIDSSHTILHANSAAASYLNTAQNKINGKKCPRLRRDSICTLCPLDAAIESGKAEHRDVYDYREKKWYVVLVSPLPFITNKNLPIFALTTVDITDKILADDNLRLEKVKSSILAVNFLELIYKMLEQRDPNISKHLKSVSSLAVAIASEIGLDRDLIEGIRVAALLHDIGKYSVPSEILCRPGKLSDVEYSFVKKHTLFGRDLIAPLSFPWSISEIIYQHHERMNGSGYPEGMRGDKICIEAKVISVAEVVVAMTSHQPYRPAHSIEDALKEIEKNRGILYDPDVANACLALFREKGFKLKE